MAESEPGPRTPPQPEPALPPLHPPGSIIPAPGGSGAIDHPRWLRAVTRARDTVLDTLDVLGDGVATIVGLRK